MNDRVKLFLVVDGTRGGLNATIRDLHRDGLHDEVRAELASLFHPVPVPLVLTLPAAGPLQDADAAPDDERDFDEQDAGEQDAGEHDAGEHDDGEQDDAEPDSQVVIGLDWMPAAQAEALLAQAKQLPGVEAHADLAIAAADMWCPGTAASPLFGELDRALALIGRDAVQDAGGDGYGVRVIIVDQGIDADRLGPPGSNPLLDSAGNPRGWPVSTNPLPGIPAAPERKPGTAPYGHGTRMAQLVLAMAPRVELYDLPLLPPRIHDLPLFLSDALPPIKQVRKHLRKRNADGSLKHPGPWVLCNAWSVYSLAGDLPPGTSGSYGSDPKSAVTRRFRKIAEPQVSLAQVPPGFVRRPGADVVFAAGNCGQFCPDGRCASPQTGPGNSIFGIAALTRVMSVGAVRSDTTWLGYSAQGPAPSSALTDGWGEPLFNPQKPDLCAPSQFAATLDAGTAYTGSSAACALAAGALAAIRSPGFRWRSLPPWPEGGAGPPSPLDLLRALQGQASLPPGVSQGDPQLGWGILDLRRFVATYGA